MRTAIRFAAAGLLIGAATIPVFGQKTAPADLAKQLSGTWMLNPELSPAFAGAGRGSQASRSSGGATHGALFLQRGALPQGVRANPTNTEPTPSGPSDLTPAERAEWRALRQVQEIQPAMAITATADHVTISDERGDLSCAVDGKTDKVRTFGVYMDVKCKWDKEQLRQEFSTPRSKLTRVWSVDANGHLVLKGKVEGINQNTPEAIIVYDRS